ncbi:MAG: hypothetical protein HY706_05910 [Candidatus Hydrogenedentes bacterium]|nr:hypothetical protein [Candidatus Hydrogenedentota bacterium]
MAEDETRPNETAVSWALVLSPLLLLFVFITLAARVRLGLGHWPTPMLEGYDTAAYRTHEQVLISVVVFAVCGAVPLWLASACLRLFRVSLKTLLLQAGAYALSWGLIALYIAIDPGRFTEWFLD